MEKQVNMTKQQKNVFILVAIVATLVVGAGIYQQWSNLAESSTGNEEKQTVCPTDAKLCEDGSSVGRIGPDCEFAKCPNELEEETKPNKPTACPRDLRWCPDGSNVGRSGPECNFAECPSEPVPSDVEEHIAERSDLITLDMPEAGNYIASPLSIRGKARGTWFFEANFTVLLVDWDGRIIAEHYATAEEDWMSEKFVPFSSKLTFASPYSEGDPDFMQRGTLILQKANPSGLPENADALEVPVWFTADNN